LTRDEILKAVVTLCAGGTTEEEDVALANHLRQELPHSKIIDLIFQDMRNLTPEQVVDEALRREADYARQSRTI
jgi:hypothetical protein